MSASIERWPVQNPDRPRGAVPISLRSMQALIDFATGHQNVKAESGSCPCLEFSNFFLYSGMGQYRFCSYIYIHVNIEHL